MNFDSTLKSYLEEKFDLYFRKIYLQNIDYKELDDLSRCSCEKYANTPYYENFCKKHYNFNIYRYYEAWLLRGDDPNLYQNGYFESCEIFEQFKLSHTDEKITTARYTLESSYLYYLYHYNSIVKETGNQSRRVSQITL